MRTKRIVYQPDQVTKDWNYNLTSDEWYNNLPSDFAGEVKVRPFAIIYANTFSSRELAESVAIVIERHEDALKELAKL